MKKDFNDFVAEDGVDAARSHWDSVERIKAEAAKEAERKKQRERDTKPDDFDGALSYSTFSQSETITPKDWIIKGVLAKGENSSWIAPPGKGKSALITDLLVSVSAGLDWRGYRSKRRGAVVYFALERADLVRRRLAAYARRNGLKDLPIAVVGCVLDLMNPSIVKIMVATIRKVAADFGLPVEAIAIDTFGKGIASGGGDEDKARDQNKVLANLRRVQELADNVHVAIIGHTGKDEGRGARGSNAHLGDVDLMVQISGDSVKTATVIKANDQPEGRLTEFRLVSYTLGHDEDGDPITTAILSEDMPDSGVADNGGQSVRKPDRLPASERRAREMLAEAILAEGQDAPYNDGRTPRGQRVVLAKTWKEYCDRGGVSGSDGAQSKERAFRRAKENLVAKHLVGCWDGYMWLVPQ